jgi:hypothetical protein
MPPNSADHHWPTTSLFADPHLWVDSRATLSIRFSMYESLVKYDKDSNCPRFSHGLVVS